MKDDKLSQMFDLEPLADTQPPAVEVTQVQEVEVAADPVDEALEQAHDDFAIVRGKMKDMLEQSDAVFEAALFTAKTSQNPKDIEAFARIMDTVTKTGKELMTMHKDIYTLKPPVVEVPQTQSADTINNIIFQGSGVDFIEFVKSKTRPQAITDQTSEE